MAWLVSEKIGKSVLMTSAEKVLIFLWNTPEKSSKHCHFTRQIAFSKNLLLHVFDFLLSDFLYTKFLFSNRLDCWLILKLFKN